MPLLGMLKRPPDSYQYDVASRRKLTQESVKMDSFFFCFSRNEAVASRKILTRVSRLFNIRHDKIAACDAMF